MKLLDQEVNECIKQHLICYLSRSLEVCSVESNKDRQGSVQKILEQNIIRNCSRDHSCVDVDVVFPCLKYLAEDELQSFGLMSLDCQKKESKQLNTDYVRQFRYY